MEIKIDEMETFFRPEVEMIQPRFQALPPGVERIKEFSALLSDARLFQILGTSEKIESIERNEDGYLIRTDNYTMQVNIKYVPEERFCGPAKFEFEFCDPISRKM